MTKRPGITMRMHACPRCGGAAFLENLDEAEWRCLQCGRTVPPPEQQASLVQKKETVRAA